MQIEANRIAFAFAAGFDGWVRSKEPMGPVIRGCPYRTEIYREAFIEGWLAAEALVDVQHVISVYHAPKLFRDSLLPNRSWFHVDDTMVSLCLRRDDRWRKIMGRSQIPCDRPVPVHDFSDLCQ